MLNLPNTLFESIVLRFQNKTKPQTTPKTIKLSYLPWKSTTKLANAKTTQTHSLLTNSSERTQGRLLNLMPAGSKSSLLCPRVAFHTAHCPYLSWVLHGFQRRVTLIKVSCCQSLHPCSWQHYSFPEKQQLICFNQRMHFYLFSSMRFRKMIYFFNKYFLLRQTLAWKVSLRI